MNFNAAHNNICSVDMELAGIIAEFLQVDTHQGNGLMVEDVKCSLPALLSRIRGVRLSDSTCFVIKENVSNTADPMLQLLSVEANRHEIQFYLTVVPCLRAVLSNRLSLPLADCPLARADLPNNCSILILEDLRVAGYHTPNLSENLSSNQLQLAVRALARVQGTAQLLAIRTARSLAQLYPQSEDDGSKAKMFIERHLELFSNAVRQVLDKETADRLLSYLHRYGQVLDYLLSREPVMKVLSHGDFWAGNLLYKDQDCRLVDWQFWTVSSPGHDLGRLIVGHAPPDLLRCESSLSQLIDDYRAEFQSVCGEGVLPEMGELVREVQVGLHAGLLVTVGSFFTALQAGDIAVATAVNNCSIVLEKYGSVIHHVTSS